MDDAGSLHDFSPPSMDAVERLVSRATDALLATQRPDGHFVFELEADCTIPSEFVLLKHYLGEPEDLELEHKISVYLRRIQGEHGGWPLYHGGAFDIRTGKPTESAPDDAGLGFIFREGIESVDVSGKQTVNGMADRSWCAHRFCSSAVTLARRRQ